MASAAIVVGADGSKASDAAVRWAAKTAARRGRRLHIVHGLDITTMRLFVGSLNVIEPEAVAKMHAHGKQILTGAMRSAHAIAPELTVTTELAESKPAQLLIDSSEAAHLVVLGAIPDIGAIAHLGSTLLAVTAHARGAVVVVPHIGAPPSDDQPVVVGVDGSNVGEAAIAVAFAEASERNAELVAVHAWSDLTVGEFAGQSYLDVPIAALEESEHTLLAERLAGWQEKYPDVRVTRTVVADGPRRYLGDWSKSAQLIVVGSRGRGGFKGLLLGSTSNWLVQHADCPVMVVHGLRT
nr:universal stress protein [Nocardia sp. XZ_19_231]